MSSIRKHESRRHIRPRKQINTSLPGPKNLPYKGHNATTNGWTAVRRVRKTTLQRASQTKAYLAAISAIIPAAILVAISTWPFSTSFTRFLNTLHYRRSKERSVKTGFGEVRAHRICSSLHHSRSSLTRLSINARLGQRGKRHRGPPALGRRAGPMVDCTNNGRGSFRTRKVTCVPEIERGVAGGQSEAVSSKPRLCHIWL